MNLRLDSILMTMFRIKYNNSMIKNLFYNRVVFCDDVISMYIKKYG